MPRTRQSDPEIDRYSDLPLTWNPDDTERFDDYIRRTEHHWLWTGHVNDRDGYGRFKPRGRQAQLAHRVAYVRWVGPIPDDKPVIDHLGHPWHLRRCVRPECLEAITHEENIRRGDSPSGRNARLTHCPRCGSEFNATNTVYRPSGERRCRVCRRTAHAQERAKAKALKGRAGQAVKAAFGDQTDPA